jgi:cytochrome c553
MKHLAAAALAAALAASPAAAQPDAATAGDAARGQTIAAGVCAACHGGDGNSPIGANPNLAAQHAEYLVKQLQNYKSGERNNPIMTAIAATLSDADARDVAAYYAAQGSRPGFARDARLASAGRALYRGGNSASGVAACSGCHSPNGAGIPVQYPRLKGQHGEYTAAQLRAFRSGERANDPASMMRGVAARMSDAEIAAVAEYISGLK